MIGSARKYSARVITLGLLFLIASSYSSDGMGAPWRSTSDRFVKPTPNQSYDSAIERYRALHDKDPQDLNTLLALSRSLRYAGRGEEAVAVLSASEGRFGDDAAYLTELGKANLVAGHVAAAQETLTQSLARSDKNWQAYSALGVANDLRGKHDEAGAAYRNALKLCPNSPTILNNLGLSAGYLGEVEQAIELLTKALSVQPKSARISRNLSMFRTLRNECPTCSAKTYKKLVSSVYPRDWQAYGTDLTCDSTVLSAAEIGEALSTKSFVDMRVNFAFDSAELLAEAKEALDQLGQAMTTEALSGHRFMLEGHTDAVGTDEYNQGLSERRAAAVKRYLVETLRIAPERLESQGFGESRLLDPKHPTNGINRRVRVVKLSTS
jgi:outer membrane protein OmpA-like peptidoglycan-associated protein